MNLVTYAKTVRLSNPVVAGTLPVQGSSVDTTGFGMATFYFLLGAIASNGEPECRIQQSSDNGATDDWADLEDAVVAFDDGDDGKVAIVEIVNPTKRYLRPVVVRDNGDSPAPQSAVDGILALLHKAGTEPVSHDASVAGAVLVLSPDEA